MVDVVKRLQKHMREKKIDYGVFYNFHAQNINENFIYLSGFNGVGVLVVPKSGAAVLVVPRMEQLSAEKVFSKVVAKDADTIENLKAAGHIAFRYVDKDGREGSYPVNPNGSIDSIAGLTDTTGRILGLMPHPERHIRVTQHPHWSRLKGKQDGDGMTIFANAIKYIQENF